MSLCSGHQASKLLKAHIAHSTSEAAASALADALGSPERNRNLDDLEDDDDDVEDDIGQDLIEDDLDGGDRECFSLLKQLQAREQLHEHEAPDAPDARVDSMDDQAALRSVGSKIHQNVSQIIKVPDEDLLFENSGSLQVQANEAEKIEKAALDDLDAITNGAKAYTLHELLQHCKGVVATSIDTLWPHLWQFLVTLRGCDRHVLPGPKNFRRKGKKWNWHQMLEHEAAKIRQQTASSAKRTSRIAAWMNLASSMSKNVSKGKLEPPQKLSAGTFVLALPMAAKGKRPTWQVACIMCLICDFLSFFDLFSTYFIIVWYGRFRIGFYCLIYSSKVFILIYMVSPPGLYLLKDPQPFKPFESFEANQDNI